MTVIGEIPRQILATVTTNTTATEGAHLPVNATAANRTITLPTGTIHGSRISVEKLDATANTVTISGSIRGSASTVVLTSQYETVELVADVAGSWWPTAGRLPLSAVSAAIAGNVAGGVGVGNAGYDETTGLVSLTVATPWGIRADGTPYYDPAGALPGEQAVLDINPTTGLPRLTTIAS